MPIRREHRFFYPIDWRELSMAIRFGRARGCCEGCGRPHGQRVFHLGDGRWWDASAATWRDRRGRRVRLALGTVNVLALARRPMSCSPPLIATTTPPTTQLPTSQPSASVAT